MGEGTAIEWATDTWNPVIGCQKVSPACTNCYAETYAAQRLGRPELWRGERHVTSASTWGLPERVDRRAARDGVRARLFVASLSDVFEDHPVWGSPTTPIDDLHPVARGHLGAGVSVRHAALRKLAALRHTDVLLLTKRPENVLRMVPREWIDDNRCDFRAKPELWPAHVWVGTTVEYQRRADERIPHLLRVPARVRFVSYEPALGPVDFTRVRNPGGESSFGPMSAFSFGLSWVIAGGESGPRARPAHPDWFRSVRDQCRRAGVPFLFKQWGEWAPEPTSGDLRGERVRWVGKRRAGRELDGVTHDAFPVTQ